MVDHNEKIKAEVVGRSFVSYMPQLVANHFSTMLFLRLSLALIVLCLVSSVSTLTPPPMILGGDGAGLPPTIPPPAPPTMESEVTGGSNGDK